MPSFLHESMLALRKEEEKEKGYVKKMKKKHFMAISEDTKVWGKGEGKYEKGGKWAEDDTKNIKTMLKNIFW